MHATSPNESRMGGATVGHLSRKLPCFLFADVTLFHLYLRLRQRPKSRGHPASKLYAESLFMQSSDAGTLVTKQANKGVHRRNTKTPRLIASGSLCV
jgi:hypothetical protein